MEPSRLPGFYRLPLQERRELLVERFSLIDAELEAFDAAGGLQSAVADHMVENAIGVLGLPLGLALNFVVDGQPVLVPMAVEEPSVIAACSFIARLAAEGGGFLSEADPPRMIGQVQLVDVEDPRAAVDAIHDAREELMAQADKLASGLKERGGGCVDVEARRVPPVSEGVHADLDDDRDMVVAHVVLDCRDAMGANAVNTVAEGLASRLEEITGGTACLRILSNLADRRLARARMFLPFSSLASSARGCGDDDGRAIAEGILSAYRLAARDPYRAATHNKGIMNGIDAVAIATGNDWRAIEAGAHAWAAREGRYSSLSRFWIDEEKQSLGGFIELPLAVGTVGGSTRVHPTVRACRKLLGDFATSADKLAGLMAAVGLAQNVGALRALATEGIQRGHMGLHARQVALAAGASGAEVERVASRLISESSIKPGRAEQILAELRAGGAP
jgi:hydroxymethylglutaryl-CoA reductase